MKKEINPSLAIALVAILVIVFSVIGYRKYVSGPGSSSAISAKEAGLGQPVLPHIPGMSPPK